MTKERTVLKFDSGADGFQAMIYILGFFAVLVLVVGTYFLITTFGRTSYG